MHDQTVIVRFDGVQEGLGISDPLCFTFMSHFVGTGGRDYFKTSWIGIASLLRTGIDLENVKIVARPDAGDVFIPGRK